MGLPFKAPILGAFFIARFGNRTPGFDPCRADRANALPACRLLCSLAKNTPLGCFLHASVLSNPDRNKLLPTCRLPRSLAKNSILCCFLHASPPLGLPDLISAIMLKFFHFVKNGNYL